MSDSPKWLRYLRFFGADVDADIQDELEFHLEAKTSELIDRGVEPGEARRRAMQHFGDRAEVAGLCRQIDHERENRRNLLERLEGIESDIRKAIRSLRSAPGFTLAAILTITAGIAGACSIVSALESWVIRAVRFPNPHELAYIAALNISRGTDTALSPADFEDIKARATRFQSLAAWTSESYTLSIDDTPERIRGARVTPNFFELLQVQPVSGRGFLKGERDRVAIVSHGFWKTRLQGRLQNSTIRLNGDSYTVVGVLPELFHFTLMGRANVWIPLDPTAADRASRQNRYLSAIGRLRAETPFEQGRQELVSITGDLASRFPATNQGIGAYCVPLSTEIGHHTGERIMWIVFGITVGLLLLACTNVANLLLVRAQHKKRDAAIQQSLGASRGRMIRQVLIETLLLFAAGGALGAFAGSAMMSAVLELLPQENRGYLPDYGVVTFNWPVFIFALGATLITGLIFGLAPALESLQTNIVGVLKESGSSVSSSVRAGRLRTMLASIQVGLAMVLVCCTAFLISNFRSVWSQPPGFDSRSLLTFRISLDDKKYPDAVQRLTFFDSVLQAAPAQSNGAAVARFIPFGTQNGGTSFRVAGTLTDEKRIPNARFNTVSASYFETMRIPLRAGRWFNSGDHANSPAVAVVNEEFAATYLKDRNPVGTRLALRRLQDREVEIVGVVGSTRETNSIPHPEVVVPFAQAPAQEAMVLIRGGTDSVTALVPEIRKRIAAIDPLQPIFEVKTIEDRMSEQFAPFQIISSMLAWFGLLAMGLSAIGVYAVIAYSASQRTREIGIRAALGAGRESLVAMFFRQGLWIINLGLIPGAMGAFAGAIVLRGLMEDLKNTSPVQPMLITGLLLAAAVLLATLIPAWKAAGSDPLAAIRNSD